MNTWTHEQRGVSAPLDPLEGISAGPAAEDRPLVRQARHYLTGGRLVPIFLRPSAKPEGLTRWV